MPRYYSVNNILQDILDDIVFEKTCLQPERDPDQPWQTPHQSHLKSLQAVVSSWGTIHTPSEPPKPPVDPFQYLRLSLTRRNQGQPFYG